MNTATLQIAIEVDDKGSVKVRDFGEAAKAAGEKGEQSVRSMKDQVVELGTKTEFSTGSLVKMGAVSFTALVGGLSAAAAGTVALIKSSGEEAKELENLARLANMAQEDFQNYAYATDTVGINQAKLADISKDLHDKLGDFINTGAGPFADFFENVAPVIGMTADELQGLSGPDVLIAVKDAMDAANLSAEEQTFYLEALASDAALLTPLLEDNGAAMKAQAEHAAALGIALSAVDSANLIAANKIIGDTSATVGSLKTKVTADLAPAFTILAETIQEQMAESELTVDELAASISSGLLQATSYALTGVETFHVGWLSLKTAVPVVVDSFQTGVSLIYNLLRKLLLPLDSVFKGIEKVAKYVGNDFTNPFDILQGKVDEFGKMTQTVMEQNFQDIADTKKKYDEYRAALQAGIQVVKAAGTAEQDTAETASKAAGQRIKQQEALTAATSKATAKQIELNAKAAAEIEDLWLAADAGRAEATERALDDANDTISQRLGLEEELADRIQELTLDTTDYKIAKLDEEVAKMREVAGEDAALQDQIAEYRKLKLQEIADANESVTNTMADAWSSFADDAKSDLEDVLGEAFTGEIDSWSDAWSSFCDSMEADFYDTLAALVVDLADSGLDSLISNLGSGGGGGGGGLWDTISGWLGFSGGGYLSPAGAAYYAEGGVITGGSGVRDDIYVGKIGGKSTFLTGGEFVVNPEATAKNMGLLSDINAGEVVGYSGGGRTGVSDASLAWSYAWDDYSFAGSLFGNKPFSSTVAAIATSGMSLVGSAIVGLGGLLVDFISTWDTLSEVGDDIKSEVEDVTAALDMIDADIVNSLATQTATIASTLDDKAETEDIESLAETFDSYAQDIQTSMDTAREAALGSSSAGSGSSYAQSAAISMDAAREAALTGMFAATGNANINIDYITEGVVAAGQLSRSDTLGTESSHFGTISGGSSSGENATGSSPGVGSMGQDNDPDGVGYNGGAAASGGVITDVFIPPGWDVPPGDQGFHAVAKGELIVPQFETQRLFQALRVGSLGTMDDTAIVMELRELQKIFLSVAALQGERVAKLEKIVDRWDKNGLPGERVGV